MNEAPGSSNSCTLETLCYSASEIQFLVSIQQQKGPQVDGKKTLKNIFAQCLETELLILSNGNVLLSTAKHTN